MAPDRESDVVAPEVVLSEATAADPTESAEEVTGSQRAYHVLDDWVIYPIIVAGVALTTSLPIFLEQRLCLPVLNGLVVFPLFAWALRARRPRRAVQLGLFWALTQAVVVVVTSLLLTERAAAAIAGGLEFRTQWLAWIASGEPVRASAALQLGELGLFSVAALLTGGLGALILLAVAINAFGFAAASLIQQVTAPLLLAVTLYPFWVVLRLVGLVAVAAVLAEPVAVLDLRPPWWVRWWKRRRRMLALGLALVGLAWLLQLLLGPAYSSLLRVATGVG